MNNNMRSIHPGEILLEEFMDPMGLTPSTLAGVLRLEPECLSAIVRQQRSISPATAQQLASYFDTSPEYWLNLQSAYDARKAQLRGRRALKRTLH
jgi:addiction module HigA family antidote